MKKITLLIIIMAIFTLVNISQAQLPVRLSIGQFAGWFETGRVFANQTPYPTVTENLQLNASVLEISLPTEEGRLRVGLGTRLFYFLPKRQAARQPLIGYFETSHMWGGARQTQNPYIRYNFGILYAHVKTTTNSFESAVFAGYAGLSLCVPLNKQWMIEAKGNGALGYEAHNNSGMEEYSIVPGWTTQLSIRWTNL